MSDREELDALRRLAELEAKTAPPVAGTPATPSRMSLPSWLEPYRGVLENYVVGTPEAMQKYKGSWQGGAMRGLSDPVAGAAQLGANALGAGGTINPRVAADEAAYQAARASQGREGTDIARGVGNAASTLPLAAIAPAASVLGRVGQGAAVGSAAAGLSPVTDAQDGFWPQKLAQMATGGAAGGLLGGAGAIIGKGADAVGRWGKDVLNLFTEKGSERVLKKYLQEQLGPAAAGEVSQAVKQATAPAVGPFQPGMQLQTAGQIVPGYAPTAAELTADTTAAGTMKALQDRVFRQARGVAPQAEQRAREQLAANRAALAPIARTPQDLAAAASARGQAADALYSKAYAQQINADPALAKLASNPFFRKNVPDALELAKAKGINPKTNLTEFLHDVKIGLDADLKRVGDTALNNAQRAETEAVRQKLIDWIGQHNPDYEAARSTFQAMSQPINQMQVGQKLDSLLTNWTGKETPGTFLRTATDEAKLLKSATGKQFPVFTPEQQRVVDSVIANQERKARAMNPMQRVTLGVDATNIAQGMTPHLPNLLSRPAMALNWGLRTLTSSKSGLEQKIDALAAQAYLHPEQLPALLQATAPSDRALLIQAIQARSRAPVTAAMGQQIGQSEGAQ